MKTIYKYKVNPLDYTIVRGPIEKFLTVDYQESTGICVWALVDTDACEKDYAIFCYGTGHKVPNDPGKYIGTVQMYSGEVVLHFFYKKLDDVERQNELIKEYDMEL